MKTIIEMATQVYGECVWHKSALHHLEAFAALVRAEERKAVVQLIKELRPAIRPLEVICKPMTTEEWFDLLVEDIRARGNT